MQLLLPGDVLPLPSTSTSTSIHLGPGLSSSTSGSGSITSTRAGLLGSIFSSTKPDKQRHWLESTLKRYTPSPPEPILGIIVARHAEGYRVDIGSSQSASLDALAFEGATKRNKPNLKVYPLSLSRSLLSLILSEVLIVFVRFRLERSFMDICYLLHLSVNQSCRV